YSVYAVVRPPAALPGAADVSVQVRGAGAASVSIIAVQFQAGREGSPAPVPADKVAGATNLWSGQVWFLRPGSYTVQISIEGAYGQGQAIVPVNILGMPGRQMGRSLERVLLWIGVALFLSALMLVRAISRDALLRPGEKPLSAGASWRTTVIATL